MTEFKTSDLSLAAYLVMKGLPITKAKRMSNGRFEFILSDLNEIADTLTVEYINSDCCKFDNQVRTIKKLLYSEG